ncbi:hypothetical protein NM208_g2808 [Fusarium decemcellulare]|uniref:Uncharacterized protein n=1 Tax=Fusarium decemcellulare TaxID=57161 RepID=A0ACC1SRG8_9HYPO|nr:hypothetical protein NM208_g2808 [Fusarium decemcellulare]
MASSDPYRAEGRTRNHPPLSQRGRPTDAERPRSSHLTRNTSRSEKHSRPRSRSQHSMTSHRDPGSPLSQDSGSRSPGQKFREFRRNLFPRSPKGLGKHDSRKSDPGSFMDLRSSKEDQDSIFVPQEPPAETTSGSQSIVRYQPQPNGLDMHKSLTEINETALQDNQAVNGVHATDQNQGNGNQGNQGITVALSDMEDVINDLQKKLDKKEKELHAAQKELEQERAEHDREIQEMDQDIKELQRQVIGAATKSTEIPVQSHLQLPESKIVEKWGDLTYDVSNLVKNHLSGIKESKMVIWAKDYSVYIKDVTPNYVYLAGNKKSSAALIEATIWNMLMMFVFGNFSASRQTCWAGRYKVKLGRLVAELNRDFAKMGSERLNVSFQQWKAFTTGIISLAQNSEDSEREVDHVVERLEDLFTEFFNIQAARQFRCDLRPIIRAAVDFDMHLCGQQVEYILDWPQQGRHGMKLDPDTMRVEVDSPKTHPVRASPADHDSEIVRMCGL